MEKRMFGRTGHESSVAIFGGAAFWEVNQKQADAVMEQIIGAGVNHIDVAPSYGVAESRIGPWMPRVRKDFFLGCKTMERSWQGAYDEMKRSLTRLQVERFDLYQIHAITTQEELDEAMRTGGAIDGLVKAREEGYTRFLGITGHGLQSPKLFLQALERFEFDSILFPLNFKLYAIPEYRESAEELLAECRKRQVGTMVIKSIAREQWHEQPKTHTTWYKPFTDPEMITRAVHFVLSQDVTGICTAGDVNVLPHVLHACETFTPMSKADQEALIKEAGEYEVIFD